VNVLLVPAHPGFPGQIPQSRKTVVCVCVYARRYLTSAGRRISKLVLIILFETLLMWFIDVLGADVGSKTSCMN